MVFHPLRYLRKNMSHAKDDEGKEVEVDWNDPFQRVKFFYEYCSPDGDKVRGVPRCLCKYKILPPFLGTNVRLHVENDSASTPSGAATSNSSP
jgi:hypothetical protein